MDLHLQGKKSPIEKVGDPTKNGSMSRTAYYTEINLKLFNKYIDLKVKVDTGAAYTVIGINHPNVERYKDKIMKIGIDGVAYDASETELKLKGIQVENFKITSEVIIPKILIFFCEELNTKAILGMDILSLFDFQYLRDIHSTNGTFWINNYEEVLSTLNKRMLNKDLDYINPSLILEISDDTIKDTPDMDLSENDSDKLYLTVQDYMANYISEQLNDEENKN